MSNKYGTRKKEGVRQPLRLFGTIKEIHEHYLKCSKLKEESPFFFDSTQPISIYQCAPARDGGVTYNWYRDVLLTNEKLEAFS